MVVVLACKVDQTLADIVDVPACSEAWNEVRKTYDLAAFVAVLLHLYQVFESMVDC